MTATALLLTRTFRVREKKKKKTKKMMMMMLLLLLLLMMMMMKKRRIKTRTTSLTSDCKERGRC